MSGRRLPGSAPRLRRQVLTLAAALALLPAFGWAAPSASSAASGAAGQAMQACRADFKKLCRGVRPGDGRGLACLKEHESELGASCREAMSQAKDCAVKARELCGADGGDADKRRACLKEHATELSQCKSAQ